jgi:hypothetical protein
MRARRPSRTVHTYSFGGHGLRARRARFASMNRLRNLLLSFATIVAVAVISGAAAHAATAAVTFVRLPSVALQGKTLAVVASVKPSGRLCTLSVRYADGFAQVVGRTISNRGQARWTWTVPEVAKAGRAIVTASCAGLGTRSRAVTVVGDLVAPKIVVEKQGFSVRAKTRGSSVSYGLLLKNVSPNADALQVYVLVNFVMADGQLIGTDAHTVDGIAAGTTYAYGGSLTFPAGAPVVQLEVVVKVGGRQRHSLPVVDNIRVLPGLYDATWVGEVDGEVINADPSLNLQSTKLSAVVFDAAGNIIGGGTGMATALLPPGTRQVFVLTSGFDAIPWGQAASARVSPSGTYVP